jgi:hypothetical protein
VRAMVYLGANACIVGRNHEKTKTVAADIETVRNGARVLGYGGVDVRNLNDLKSAVDKCAKELGSIDFVMLVPKHWTERCLSLTGFQCRSSWNISCSHCRHVSWSI